jgi:hypothetical protein
MYGPETDERFNLESTLPKQWVRKIQKAILPNNRRILSIVEANRRYLTGDEIALFELYRQHVDDFEAKHLGLSDVSGTRFPRDFAEVFKNGEF